jgi:hypothetical protein
VAQSQRCPFCVALSEPFTKIAVRIFVVSSVIDTRRRLGRRTEARVRSSEVRYVHARPWRGPQQDGRRAVQSPLKMSAHQRQEALQRTDARESVVDISALIRRPHRGGRTAAVLGTSSVHGFLSTTLWRSGTSPRIASKLGFPCRHHNLPAPMPALPRLAICLRP